MTRIARNALACLAAIAAFASVPRPSVAATLDYVPDAVAGKPDFTAGADGVVSATNILWAAAIAEDPISGELWVADHFGSRVLRFASANAFANGEAADLVLGQADFVSDRANRGGAIAANTLYRPTGVAVDEARRVYIADTENNRILVFRPPFANGMDAALVIGQPDLRSGLPNRDTNGGSPNENTLNRPHGLALDSAGRLWVADLLNARVLGYQPWNGRERPPPVYRVIGQASQSANAPSLTARGMSQPAGVAIDPFGRLWVADQGFHRVMLYQETRLIENGAAAIKVACQADFTSALAGVGPKGCFMPTALAYVGDRVLIADFGNNRILRMDESVTLAEAVVGQAGFDGRDCNRGASRPTHDTFCGPRALLADRRGNLLVADAGNGRILRFDIPEARRTPQGFPTPQGIARSPAGATIAVVGENFHDDSVVHWRGQPRVTRFVSPKRLVATLEPGDLASEGTQPVTVVTPAPGGGVSAAKDVAVGTRAAGDSRPDRQLGLAAIANTDPARAPGGEAVGGVNAARFQSPRAVAIDEGSGRLFVADSLGCRVLSWPSHADFRDGQPADLLLGVPDAFTSGCPSTHSARTLCSPEDVAVDEAGRLYVADSATSRVLRFDPPFSTGMAASGVYGQRGSFDTGEENKGGRGATSLVWPKGVVARDGKLFVSDSGNGRVLVFDNPLASDVATVVLGQAGATEAPDDSAVSAARLGTRILKPALDGSGRLYILDGSRNRVVRFSPPFTTGMAADLVIGQPDFTSRSEGSTSRTLRGPLGLAVDAEGNVLVADSYNNRVLRFTAPLANGMAAAAVLGQASPDAVVPVTGHELIRLPTSVAVDAAGNVLVTSHTDRSLLAFDRPFGVETSKRLVNIATRMAVLQGDDVLIGGFIIGGTAPKKVVVRARGPSLGAFGIANPLANPLLQLFSGANPIAANDNWQQAANVAEIQASGFAPAHPFESAILMTLEPGAYTAIVSGAGGVTGVGIVEVFEVDGAASPLVNIATRGRVLTGDNVLIGGFVISGDSPQTVVIRARGPSLAAAGVPNPLANPLLRLFAGDGTALLTNDDWTVAPNAVAIQASGFVPSDPRESAILVTLNPGAYTAVVSGVGNTTGLAIVEVFVP